MIKQQDAWVQRRYDKIVAAASLAGGYSSMETAPRDGTHILVKQVVFLYDQKYREHLPVGCKWTEFWFVDGEFREWTGTETCSSIGGAGELLGWAPLPHNEAPWLGVVTLPAFDGYQEHIVRELQAAFMSACEKANIRVNTQGDGA